MRLLELPIQRRMYAFPASMTQLGWITFYIKLYEHHDNITFLKLFNFWIKSKECFIAHYTFTTVYAHINVVMRVNVCVDRKNDILNTCRNSNYCIWMQSMITNSSIPKSSFTLQWLWFTLWLSQWQRDTVVNTHTTHIYTRPHTHTYRHTPSLLLFTGITVILAYSYMQQGID